MNFEINLKIKKILNFGTINFFGTFSNSHFQLSSALGTHFGEWYRQIRACHLTANLQLERATIADCWDRFSKKGKWSIFCFERIAQFLINLGFFTKNCFFAKSPKFTKVNLESKIKFWAIPQNMGIAASIFAVSDRFPHFCVLGQIIIFGTLWDMIIPIYWG